jgi:hypothetical protein
VKLLTPFTAEGPRLAIRNSAGNILADHISEGHAAPSSLEQFIYERSRFDAWADSLEAGGREHGGVSMVSCVLVSAEECVLRGKSVVDIFTSFLNSAKPTAVSIRILS